MTIHLEDDGRHVQQLARKVRQLQKGFADQAASDDYSELFKIIHFPGYTTPAQWRMILGLAEAAELNLRQGVVLRAALLEGSRAVLEENAVVAV
jgi:hypothetical protein